MDGWTDGSRIIAPHACRDILPQAFLLSSGRVADASGASACIEGNLGYGD